jgi:heat shock protein HslJ
MTRSKPFVTLLIVGGLFMTACQSTATPPTQVSLPTQAPQASQPAPSGTGQPLAGPVWKWTTTQMNDGSSKTPSDPNNYLIEFLANGHVAVQADCNRVAGTYTANGDHLAITLGPSTLAACPPGSLGDEFVKQLVNISSYLFKGENLILEIKMDSGSMIFAPSVPAGLPGTSWEVLSYNNGREAVVGLLTGTDINLNFGTDGKASGNAGCNSYSGDYQTSGKTLKVGSLTGTRMFCDKPSGVMDQEKQYLEALQSAATFEIAGDTLTIRDANGAMQVLAAAVVMGGVPQGQRLTGWAITRYYLPDREISIASKYNTISIHCVNNGHVETLGTNLVFHQSTQLN